MPKTIQPKPAFPKQHQNTQPGKESEMDPKPVYDNPQYRPAGKLQGKVALITGADSGIGRAVAIAFAKEGADIAMVYLNEEPDAIETDDAIANLGRKCIKITADLKCESSAQSAVQQAIDAFSKLDILINNAAIQQVQNSILDITDEQMKHTFESNIFSMFYITKHALPHLQSGSAIVNTASVTAFEGNEQLIDYASTKGAIVTFTRSMAASLVQQGIRVNAVAPGPVWTPLIVSSYSPEDVETFGTTTLMKRAGQPYELAPAYVYLASEDASFVTGQILHVNGGQYFG